MKRIASDDRQLISLAVNGTRRRGYASPRMLLSDFLRHELGMTGTHVGCEHGVCGACTVLVDGVAQRSCLALAVQADSRDVCTVEGLTSKDGELNGLQTAFRRHHALQCGFCTAGILMSCTDYLRRVASPTEDQVRAMLSGHLCRCTGYTTIVQAVMAHVAERAGARTEQADSGDA
jgi:2-furoyl-CoA dehydrogenase 2Fe-2S iron sulfur subunit